MNAHQRRKARRRSIREGQCVPAPPPSENTLDFAMGVFRRIEERRAGLKETPCPALDR